MAADPVTGKVSGAGLRHVQLIPLDDNGYPFVSAAAGTMEAGYRFELAKAMTPTFPEPQIIQHTGDDRVGGMTVLPPTELATYEMRTGMTDLEIEAVIEDLNTFAVGEATMKLMVTSKQGEEPEMGIIAYRQATDTKKGSATRGLTRWLAHILPSTRVVHQGSPFEEGAADEHTYGVYPDKVSKHLWGVDFTVATEGDDEGQVVVSVFRGQPILNWALGNDTLHEYTFADEDGNAVTVRQRADGDYAVTVWHYVASTGTVSDVTSALTITATTIDFGAGSEPETDDIVIALIEQA